MLRYFSDIQEWCCYITNIFSWFTDTVYYFLINKLYLINCNRLVFFMSVADTPFAQVKVGEITSWLARREKNPSALAGAFSRAWWRWNHKYVQPKRAGIAPFLQVIVGSMVFFYAINYGKLSKYSVYILVLSQKIEYKQYSFGCLVIFFFIFLNNICFFSCRATP